MTWWDIPIVSLGKSCVFVFCWALVPFPLLRCFLSKRKSGRGICVSSFGFGFSWCFVDLICRFFVRPRCFTFMLLISLFAFPMLGPSLRAISTATEGKKGGRPGFRSELCCFSHMSLYGDVMFLFCSFCFVVSRHTNPSDDA